MLPSNSISMSSMCVFSEKRDEVARIKDDLRCKGMDVPPDKLPSEHFDSNCITPVGHSSLSNLGS